MSTNIVHMHMHIVQWSCRMDILFHMDDVLCCYAYEWQFHRAKQIETSTTTSILERFCAVFSEMKGTKTRRKCLVMMLQRRQNNTQMKNVNIYIHHTTNVPICSVRSSIYTATHKAHTTETHMTRKKVSGLCVYCVESWKRPNYHVLFMSVRACIAFINELTTSVNCIFGYEVAWFGISCVNSLRRTKFLSYFHSLLLSLFSFDIFVIYGLVRMLRYTDAEAKAHQAHTTTLRTTKLLAWREI